MSRVSTSPEVSEKMRSVGRSHTPAELAVAAALRRLKVRFRRLDRELPGSPDLVVADLRWAIFVHGCFWHRHKGCRKATMPKSNIAFWVEKFGANARRDQRVVRALQRRGFRVSIIWECETLSPHSMQRRLERRAKALRSQLVLRSAGVKWAR